MFDAIYGMQKITKMTGNTKLLQNLKFIQTFKAYIQQKIKFCIISNGEWNLISIHYNTLYAMKY